MNRLWISLVVCTALSGCAAGTNWLYKGYGAAPVDADLVVPYAALVNTLKTGDAQKTPLINPVCFGLATADSNGACQRQRNNRPS